MLFSAAYAITSSFSRCNKLYSNCTTSTYPSLLASFNCSNEKLDTPMALILPSSLSSFNAATALSFGVSSSENEYNINQYNLLGDVSNYSQLAVLNIQDHYSVQLHRYL